MIGRRIHTARLILDVMGRTDVDAVHRLSNEPGVRRFLWDDRRVERGEIEAVRGASEATFRERGFGIWVLGRPGGSRTLGFCGLRVAADTLEVEIVYAIAERWWGRGFTTEAARAVLRYGFEECALERVVGLANPANEASWRVLERVGMRRERVRKTDTEDLLAYAVDRASFRADGAPYALHV